MDPLCCKTASVAAKNDHPNCFEKRIFEPNFYLSTAGRVAIDNGSLSCLIRAFDKTGRLTHLDTNRAVFNNNVECLDFLIRSGCDLYRADVDSAAYGSIDCLKLLHASNCEIDVTNSLKIALERKHKDCVDFIVEITDIDDKMIQYVMSKHPQLTYLESKELIIRNHGDPVLAVLSSF